MADQLLRDLRLARQVVVLPLAQRMLDRAIEYLQQGVEYMARRGEEIPDGFTLDMFLAIELEKTFTRAERELALAHVLASVQALKNTDAHEQEWVEQVQAALK
jgi:hypothetical protein